MRILHLSNTPLSNAPDNLVQCLKDSGHDAKLLLGRKTNINKTYVGGQLWREIPPGILEEEFKLADVLHFHNFCWTQDIFKERPELLPIAKSKPGLIQFHSPRYSTESFEDQIADKHLKKAVIAQYHTRLYPECEFIVPNVLPIYKTMYTPMVSKWDDPCPLISYAPSNTSLKDWDDKGFSFTQPILKAFERDRRCAIDIITNTDYETCMLKKRWAHLGIDECATGSYHLSTLEYLSMGVVTFCYMDELTQSALKMIVGEEGLEELPVYNTNRTGLAGALLMHLDKGREGLQMLGAQSRAWMEKYWSPAYHAARFEKIYASL